MSLLRYLFTFGPCTFWTGHDWRGVYDDDGACIDFECRDCRFRKSALWV